MKNSLQNLIHQYINFRKVFYHKRCLQSKECINVIFLYVFPKVTIPNITHLIMSFGFRWSESSPSPTTWKSFCFYLGYLSYTTNQIVSPNGVVAKIKGDDRCKKNQNIAWCIIICIIMIHIVIIIMSPSTFYSLLHLLSLTETHHCSCLKRQQS